MADLTAAQVNSFTNTPTRLDADIFVVTGGKVFLDLDALTGDTLGATLTSINLSEAAIKLAKVLGDTAVNVFAADSTKDARSTYPGVTAAIVTKADASRVTRYTGSFVGEQVLSFDNVRAL